jgi:hypothetical protein
MDEVKTWRGIDIALAVAAALIVAYGVWVLGWSVFVVIALFWFENVVIGVFNVAKMLITGARTGHTASMIAALALSVFFTVHYGMFTVAHGVFVVGLFGQGELGSSQGLFAPLSRMLGYLLADRDGWLAAAGITALQATVFFRWLSATRVEPLLLPALMFAPYGRIVILHVTIIVSGILAGMLKLPVLGALLLVALKLAFDIVAANTSARTPGPLQRMPVQRFFISHEDDAKRP